MFLSDASDASNREYGNDAAREYTNDIEAVLFMALPPDEQGDDPVSVQREGADTVSGGYEDYETDVYGKDAA